MEVDGEFDNKQMYSIEDMRQCLRVVLGQLCCMVLRHGN